MKPGAKQTVPKGSFHYGWELGLLGFDKIIVAWIKAVYFSLLITKCS